MMRLAPFVLMLSCGYAPDDYQADVAAASCQLTIDCMGFWDTVDECVAAQQVEDTRGCEYDATAAKDCVEALESTRCGDGSDIPAEPVVCQSVWTCGD